MQATTNNLVSPLLTDLYQITMAYSYFKNNKHNQTAVFDLFFRKNPFGGEYVVFAGLDECVRLWAFVIFTNTCFLSIGSSRAIIQVLR